MNLAGGHIILAHDSPSISDETTVRGQAKIPWYYLGLSRGKQQQIDG